MSLKEKPHMICLYIDNLIRLKLIDIDEQRIDRDSNKYQKIIENPTLQNIISGWINDFK